MHDMERRRQIALKALSERLSRTTDSSRANLLPRSFPHSHHHGHHGGHHGHHAHPGHHGHHGHHHGSDSDQPSFIAPPKMSQTFVIPAIPLPPPPAKEQPEQQSIMSDNATRDQTQNTTTPEDLIALDDSMQTTSHTSS